MKSPITPFHQKLTAHPWRVALLPLLAGMLAVSCSKEDQGLREQDYGRLRLSVTIDATVSSTDGSVLQVPAPARGEFALALACLSSDGHSGRWDSFDDFPQGQRYLTGDYEACLTCHGGEEGFVSPTFRGVKQFSVLTDETTEATVTATVAQGVFQVTFSDALIQAFPEFSLTLHTSGGDFVNYTSKDAKYCYLNPGECEIYANLGGSENVRFMALNPGMVDAATFHPIAVDYDPLTLEMTINDAGKSNSVTLDREFLLSPPPSVSTRGFESRVPLTIPEGSPSPNGASFFVESRLPLSKVMLSANSAQMRDQISGEMNLLDLSPIEKERLEAIGIKADLNRGGGEVNLEGLVTHLNCPGDAGNVDNKFTITAIAENGKISEPQTLSIITEEMDLQVIRVPKALIGASEGEIVIKAPSDFSSDKIGIKISEDNGRTWAPATLTGIQSGGEDSETAISFTIPGGDKPVKARLYYCGELRHEFTIERYQPTFKIEVDAYAHRAIIKIVPDDPSRLATITRYARIYVNGIETPVYHRDSDNGLIAVIGLNESTTYSISATALTGEEEENAPEVKIRTESTPALPNGDFEETKESINVKYLLSGGRYSQNNVEIFNCQNHVEYKLSTPSKGWANVNSKTFCTQSANRNTWYMQPSTFTVSEGVSGAYAVRIVSTAFDPAGEKIPDYLQLKPPYLKYSLSIPHIRYRAAGRLFLGSYGFDPETVMEKYEEGVKFGSRPLSLSGFYKYVPCTDQPGDKGLASVEVYGTDGGKEILIGHGQTLLPLAIGYTAFNVDVAYDAFGIKATRLCLTLSSTKNAGTIAQETRDIVTHDDPEKSISLGSVLTVDNLLLAY